MRYIPHLYFFILCMSIQLGTAGGQSTGFYKTHQSGDWNNSVTWERYNGSVWIWPAAPPSAETSEGILIAAGHEVGIGGLAVSADQFRLRGTLRVNIGARLTIVDGPGTDLELEDPNALLIVRGDLVNKGTIIVDQGGLQIGTVENNGEIIIGGVFQFNSGTFTGNDIRYGPTGSLVINFPGYVVDQEDHFWPVENGPAAVRITNSIILNSHRTITGTLEVSGDLHVVDSLTNAGTTTVTGTLQLTGTFANDGIIDIPGIVQVNTPTAVVTGNSFAYLGCCSQLIIKGPGDYVIEEDNLIWPETAPPEILSVPGFGDNAARIILNATRSTGQLDISFHARVRVAGDLTVNTGGEIDGVLQVDGAFSNNGTLEIYQCQVSGTLTNNGTFQIYSFQLEEGGNAVGKGFTYEPSGILTFNNNFNPLEVDTTSAHWPAENGPSTVKVQGEGGIVVNVPRIIPGLLQLAGPITNAGNLTLAKQVQIHSGGSLDTPPFYTANATLIYNISGSYDVGPEWSDGFAAGPGVPQNVEIPFGATVIMPDGARRCPGELSIWGTLELSTAPGADLSLGGDLENYGMLVSNSRQVILDGSSRQALTGATTVDYLTVNNPAGIRVPGGFGDAFRTDSVTVNEVLTFVSGNILLGESSGILTITQSPTGASDTSHVLTYGGGWIWGLVDPGESLTFPISFAETIYTPVTVTLDASLWIGTLFRTRVDPGINVEGIDSKSSVANTWTVSPACFSGELTFQWDALLEGLNFTRDTAAVYRGGMELPSGMTLGTDPYTMSTTFEQPCPSFPPTDFIISNAEMVTAVPEITAPSFFLDQNKPNPFQTSTLIRYSIPETDFVQLTVFDALGREIEKLVDEQQIAGLQELEWRPAGLADGVYFYRLRVGNRMTTKVLILKR